jgi:hypothetical protein
VRVRAQPGWVFKPQEVQISCSSESCNDGNDVNFELVGFELSGHVEAAPAAPSCKAAPGEVDSNCVLMHAGCAASVCSRMCWLCSKCVLLYVLPRLLNCSEKQAVCCAREILGAVTMVVAEPACAAAAGIALCWQLSSRCTWLSLTHVVHADACKVAMSTTRYTVACKLVNHPTFCSCAVVPG